VHGFPDDHTVWSSVATLLSDDLHLVAFDVRGSGTSCRPKDFRSYRLDQLASDIVAVADAVAPGERVHVVGHDWGSVQAWHAVSAPSARDRFASLTSISGGCLDHVPGWLRARLRDGASGRRAVASMWKSPFYMSFLQTPGVGNIACRTGVVDLAVEWALRFEAGTRPDTLSRHRARDNRDGLKIYTANLLPRLLRPRPRRTHVPVQVLVPRRDVFITPQTASLGAAWASQHIVYDVEGGHWAAAFNPGPIAARIAEFVHAIEANPANRSAYS
jgi:pimeloyl-ACP methyl ester carboxylesterase